MPGGVHAVARGFDRLTRGVAAALWVSMLATGCAEDPVALSLSWVLADARGCEAAGVSEVEVAVTSALRASSRFSCEEGIAPGRVELGAFESGVVRIEVEALSRDEVVLYRAEGLTDLRDTRNDVRMQLAPVAAQP